MNELIRMDAATRPELFRWNGGVARHCLQDWQRTQALSLPLDLLSLWEETGGGELFESETILAPPGCDSLGEDVSSVNRFHRSEGMPDGYLLIHVGLGLTAVRLNDMRFVTLEPGTYKETAVFNSLEDWYRGSIRTEYAERYKI